VIKKSPHFLHSCIICIVLKPSPARRVNPELKSSWVEEKQVKEKFGVTRSVDPVRPG